MEERVVSYYTTRMHSRKYLIVALVIGAIAGLFFASPFLQDLFFAVAGDAAAYARGHSLAAVVFFVLLAAFSAMISPFSSVAIIPFAVALWGVWTTSALLILGWFIGDMIAYAVGRYAAHPLIAQFMKEETLTRYEHNLSDSMTLFRAFLLRLALPAEVGYAFGLIKYHFGAYMIVTVLAEVPFAFLTVRAADALVTLDVRMFAVWTALLVVLVGAAYVFFTRSRHRA